MGFGSQRRSGYAISIVFNDELYHIGRRSPYPRMHARGAVGFVHDLGADRVSTDCLASSYRWMENHVGPDPAQDRDQRNWAHCP